MNALPPGYYLLLNAGTPLAKMFLPKETAWLKKVFLTKKK
jgi:hypothetical protein